MTLGKLNASIGLLIAALVSTYIIYRLHEASAPLPTLVKVSNLGNVGITINELRIGGHSGGADAATMPPRTAQGAVSLWESKTVSLEPGRSIDMTLKVTGVNSGVASCTLPMRPPGVCFIQANYHGVADLRCEYVCEGDVTPE